MPSGAADPVACGMQSQVLLVILFSFLDIIVAVVNIAMLAREDKIGNVFKMVNVTPTTKPLDELTCVFMLTDKEIKVSSRLFERCLPVCLALPVVFCSA